METKFHKDLRINVGEAYEIWVCQKWPSIYGKTLTRTLTRAEQYAKGDTYEGVEIKNDRLIDTYGRVYIEMEEKADEFNEHYVSSGIYSNAGFKWYLVGDHKRWYIFDREVLIQLDKDDPPWLYRPKPTGTSIGFCIPLDNAADLCEKYQEFAGGPQQELDEDGKLRNDDWFTQHV